MVEKIEKVARVKGVDYDVGRRFKERNKDDNDDSGFAGTLNRVINKQKESENSVKIPDAYRLELSSIGTQSLFYFGGLKVNELLH